MPYFILEITAELKKIAQLEPNSGVDDAEMSYFFTLMCENCGEISKEVCTHASTWDNDNEDANLVLECQGCERIGMVNLIPGHGAPLTQQLANAQEYAPLMLFQCDGLIPYCYVFNGGWKVTLNSGAQIWNCNLLGGNFIADGKEGEGDGQKEEEEEEDEGYGKEQEEDGPSVLNAKSRFTQYWM